MAAIHALTESVVLMYVDGNVRVQACIGGMYDTGRYGCVALGYFSDFSV